MAAAAAAGPAAAPPNMAAAFDRDEWEQQLKVGDLLDVRFDGDDVTPTGWYVCRVVEATPGAGELEVQLLHWDQLGSAQRSDPDVQPLASKTRRKFTGPRERLATVLWALTLPQLTPIPLHDHHLQRFRFDFDWECDGCKSDFDGKNKAPAYSCLPCKFDFCVDCFLAAGGVDTHPLPCEPPPAKRLKLENYSQVEFVDELGEFECVICCSAAFHPPNLVCGHLFCSSCLSKVNPPKCPTCRASFNFASLPLAGFVQRQLQQKKVRCFNQKLGCQWDGMLGVDEQSLTDHLLVCGERRFLCPRCAKEIRVVDAKKHGDEECKVKSNPPGASAKREREEECHAAAAAVQPVEDGDGDGAGASSSSPSSFSSSSFLSPRSSLAQFKIVLRKRRIDNAFAHQADPTADGQQAVYTLKHIIMSAPECDEEDDQDDASEPIVELAAAAPPAAAAAANEAQADQQDDRMEVDEEERKASDSAP